MQLILNITKINVISASDYLQCSMMKNDKICETTCYNSQIWNKVYKGSLALFITDLSSCLNKEIISSKRSNTCEHLST